MLKRIIYISIIIVFIETVVFAQEFSTNIPDNSLYNETVSKISSGDFLLSPKKIIDDFLSLLFNEFRQSKELLISIFIIALMSGVLSTINTEKMENNAGTVAFFTCFTLMATQTAKLINTSVGYSTDIINEMSDFVTKLAPILSILLVSGGYTSCASSFYPVFTTSIYFISLICQNIITPMIYISCVIGIVNNMSNKIQLTHFNNLIKSATKWILTASLTIFSGINAIYGFCAPALDTIGMKTAKFAVGSFVPVVGGFLAESIETVLTGTRLMKNAVGTAGIITLITTCSIPCIKTLAIMLVLKLCAAIIEPLCDKRFSNMIMEAADAVTMIFAMLLTVVMLFILSISIIIATTNYTI